MNWLRENWFDALLFLLLTAVVVAIVLFLTGINPFARRAAPAVATPPPAKTEPAAPPPAEPAAPPPASTTATPAAGEEVTVLPLPPAISEESPAPTQTAGTGAAAGGSPSATPAPATPSAAPAPTTAQGSGIYRVSVGAFTRPEYAVDLAKKLKEQGYPVRIEVIGRVSRVVVGPYTSRAEAERVKAALAQYEPQVYRGDTPIPEGTYLQVGAFKTLERARTLAADLKAKGFPVVVYYRDGWAKVWVGPLDPERLAEVRAQLEESGFQPVEVRGG